MHFLPSPQPHHLLFAHSMSTSSTTLPPLLTTLLLPRMLLIFAFIVIIILVVYVYLSATPPVRACMHAPLHYRRLHRAPVVPPRLPLRCLIVYLMHASLTVSTSLSYTFPDHSRSPAG